MTTKSDGIARQTDRGNSFERTLRSPQGPKSITGGRRSRVLFAWGASHGKHRQLLALRRPRSYFRIQTSCLIAVLVVAGMVVSPISSVPAGATPLGTVLILSSSVTGGSSSAEAAAATADGYTVQVDNGTTWAGLSESTFASYSAVILGDPSCGTSASSAIGAAVSDASTWSPAITGNVVIAGNAPVAGASGANPSGASTFTDDAIVYALAGGSGKTGLYVSLSCYYAAASSGTSVPLLSGLGSFSVNGSAACGDSGTVNVPVEDGALAFHGMTNATLLGWSCSLEETFATWPTGYQALAVDEGSTPSDFTGPDGITGQPYVLVNNTSSISSFGGSSGGVVPTSATYGAKNPAAPGLSDGIATVGSGVNPENGDLTQSSTDASVATFGPPLTVNRTYDSQLAQAQTATAKPGIFGYGWSSNVGASLHFNSPTPNDIYRVAAGFNGPVGETIDSTGNIYVADSINNEVDEIAGSTHTQWGISMSRGSKYVVAGNGVYGSSGSGGAATSAELLEPEYVSLDTAGDLYISDFSKLWEVPASSGTQWGISMTAGDIYTIAGTGSYGCTTSGSAATSTDLFPGNVGFDAAGDLYVPDATYNRVLEIAKTTHTQWGTSMTAGHAYTVAGSSTCASGHSGDGGAADSAKLDGELTVMLDSSGDLIIADSDNNRIQEVAGTSATQWGISMTAGDIYTIAGSASGTSGDSGDGGTATSALLNYPNATALSPAGDLYISDSSNSRVQELAKNTRTQWSQAMTANNIYTVAGSASGSSGSSGDGGAATSALLSDPDGLAVDQAGNVFISDGINDNVREMVATAPGQHPVFPTPSGITVNQADGAQVTFVPAVSGSCPSPFVGPGTSGTYCSEPYVTATLIYNSGSSTYTFTTHPYNAETFNASGQLISDASPGGATLSMAYATPSPGSGSCPTGASSCDTVTSASGRSLVLGLDSQGLITTVTDPLGNVWTYAYSGGDLTSVTDPLSRVTSYTYDSSNANPDFVNDVLTSTPPNGQSGGSSAGDKWQDSYDTSGRVTSQTDPSGFTTSLSYAAMDTPDGDGATIVTDPDGNVSNYFYVTGALTSKVIGWGSAVPSDTYYNRSNTTLLDSSVIDPDGGATAFTYDTDGNVLTSTDQLGNVSSKSYNAFDEVTCSTTPLASAPCSSLSPPSAVSPGGTISPPSSAPPPFATYTLYDTSGNQLWQTAGIYQPGTTSTSSLRTTYNLYSGNSVTLGTTTDSCGATPPSGSLACATVDADGNVIQLGYDSAGDVTSSATPDGNGTELATTTNSYNADGNVVSSTNPEGNLTGANAANYTTTTTYDADNEPLIVTLAGGTGATVSAIVTATYYDADGNTAATTDAGGNPYSTANPTGCNPMTTSSCASTIYDVFNADDQQTLVQDPAGHQTLSCYDGDGTVAETVPAYGVAHGSLTPSSCPTSYSSGYPTSPLASDATITAYDALGNQTVETTPPATGGSARAETTTVNDPDGNAIETVAPPATSGGASNQITVDTYDLAGQMLTETTGFGTSGGSTTSNCYDPDGNQTATVPGAGNSSGVQVCGTTSPWSTSSSLQTSSSFDSLGELISATSPPPAGTSSPAVTSYTYDDAGNKLSETDPTGAVTDYSYNPLNKLISTSTSGQNSTTYLDANGDAVAVTSPGGNPYNSVTNPGGCDPLTTSSCSFTTYNTYDDAGNLLISTNPDGATTTNYYDTSGNKIATTGPSGNPSTCNPTTSSTPCADTTTDEYNSLNQLICQGEPNPANNTCASPGSGAGIVAYTYTTDGQRASMTDGTGTTSYSYDSSDRLTSVTNGAGAVVGYAYGQNSDPTCISYPNSSGNTCSSSGTPTGIVRYTYNQSNQVTSMTDWAGNTFNLSYNADDSQSDLSVNSGAVDVATSYDSSNDVSSIDATAPGGAGTLLDLSVTRNANGTIATETPQVGSTIMATDSYGYDALNQVTSGPITGSSGSNAYAYTPDGGITQFTTTFASAAYDQADELCWTSATSSTNACGSPPTGATTYVTNTDGERTLTQPSTGNPSSYAWDSALGRLSCANTNGTTCSTSSPTSSTTLYTYDGDGLRTSSTQASTTTNYTWDISASIPKLLSDGTWDYLYVPGSSVPVEQIATMGSSPTADLLLTDENDSVRGLVQLSSGAEQDELVNYSDYDAYGNPITESGGSMEAGGLTVSQTSINLNFVGTTAFGFGGGYTDPTGWIYLVSRYYDPVTGQFLSIDPLLRQTDQPYVYVLDDPVNATDSNGLGVPIVTVSWALSFGIPIPPFGINETVAKFKISSNYAYNGSVVWAAKPSCKRTYSFPGVGSSTQFCGYYPAALAYTLVVFRFIFSIHGYGITRKKWYWINMYASGKEHGGCREC